MPHTPRGDPREGNEAMRRSSSMREEAGMFTPMGLDHVVFRVRDQAAAQKFYVDVLGCTVDHVNERISLIHLRFGEAYIDLLPATAEAPAAAAGGRGGAPPPARGARLLGRPAPRRGGPGGLGGGARGGGGWGDSGRKPPQSRSRRRHLRPPLARSDPSRRFRAPGVTPAIRRARPRRSHHDEYWQGALLCWFVWPGDSTFGPLQCRRLISTPG